MGVDKDLLEILVCPVDRAPVREQVDHLVCVSCGRRYPVRDGIPVMLADQAEMPIRDPNDPPQASSTL